MNINIEAATGTQYIIDDFMDLFIAALVLHDKRHIWIRGDRALKEQECMWRLHRFLTLYCARSKSTPKPWRSFIINMRNATAPSSIGSFDTLRWLFSRKQLTYVSMRSPYFESYDLDMGIVTARYLLSNHEHPELRRLAECAAKIYTAEHSR